MNKGNFEFYTANQENIVNGHLGEYVVIKDASVIEYFNEENRAFEAMKNNELGTFMVKKCQKPGTDIITYYNNNVAFA